MKKLSLTQLIFMALCCDLGLFSKKLVAPVANIITEFLHIPGGISTSFSIMFIVVGAALCDETGCATLMCVVQSGLALALGKSGSMGLLAPIGYIMPGIVIDISFFVLNKLHVSREEKMAITNGLAGMTAAITANLIVFRLSGPPLWLYLSVALFCGGICGLLASSLVKRLLPQIRFERKEKEILK